MYLFNIIIKKLLIINSIKSVLYAIKIVLKKINDGKDLYVKNR